MKFSPVMVAMLAVVSSAATVLVLELRRERREARVEAFSVTEEPPARPALSPQGTEGDAGAGREGDERVVALEQRLLELERRLAQLERGREPTPSRHSLAPEGTESEAAGPPEEALRELVMGWMEEEREARAQAAAQDQVRQAEAQRDFQARYQARMMADSHGLEPWQEQRLVELFREVGEREAQLNAQIDPAVDDPAEVEARWERFDAWVDQRERDVTFEISPALYDEIYGEPDAG